MRIITPNLMMLVLALAIGDQPSRAAILTVSNDPLLPAQFTTIQAAHDAANAGDTVFVHGTTTIYNVIGFTITKPIYLLGVGYDPYAPNLRSRITAQLSLGTGSDGCIVEGMDLGIVSIGQGRTTIRNCRLTQINLNNNGLVTAIGNVVIRTGQFTLQNDSYLIRMNSSNSGIQEFRNNVFASQTISGFGNSTTMFFGLMQNSIFQNNIFLAWGNAPRRLQYPYSDPDLGGNTFFFNNIFYNLTDVATSCTGCSFSNNLVQGCIAPDCLLVDIVNGQTGGNNLDIPITDPTFVDYMAGAAFDPVTHDLNLLPGTPGIGAGVGGTDLGVHGGSDPMVPGSFHDRRLRRLPYQQSFNIINTAVPEGCPIEYSVTGDIIQFPSLAEGVITGAEIYFDQDPGPGTGIPVDIASAASIDLDLCLDTLLTPGSYRMCFRLKTNSGLWSAPRCGSILILDLPCNQDPCATTTSVHGLELDAQEVMLLPNPNDGRFTVMIPEGAAVIRMEVLDALGRSVPFENTGGAGTSRLEIAIDHEAPGPFFLRLSFDNGTSRTLRVLVRG